MKYRLRSFDYNPPGNYIYLQTQGIRREFPAQPDIIAQANLVYQFRKGNNLARASVKEAVEDISCYTCFRLGNMPQFCVPVDGQASTVALNSSSPVIAPPCPTCGIKIQ